MTIAHYKCLSTADWLAVKQERLMLDMPLSITWPHMDDRMLNRFFARHPDKLTGLYKHAPAPLGTLCCGSCPSGTRH
jgi:hypothetical protein